MAARQRKTNESLKQYRKNLINEEFATQLKLKGRMVYNSDNGPATVRFRHFYDVSLSPANRYYI